MVTTAGRMDERVQCPVPGCGRWSVPGNSQRIHIALAHGKPILAGLKAEGRVA